MKAWLQEKSIDFVLCLLAASALAYNYFGAFVIPVSMTRNILLTVLLCAAVLLILHVTFFNLKSSLISGTAVAAFLVVAGLWANRSDFLGKTHIVWQEKDAYYLLILFCVILVYACSRSRVGAMLLFLTGMLSAFFMGILEYTMYPAAFILFLLGAGILFLRRSFVKHKTAGEKQKGPGLRYTATSVVLCGLALVLAAASFVVITVTLHPRHQSLALLTNYTVLQMTAKTGAASPKQARQAEQNYQQKINPKKQQSTASQTVSSQPVSSTGTNRNSFPTSGTHGTEKVPAKPVTYFQKTPWLLIILCSAFAILAALYFMKYFLRRSQMQQFRQAKGKKKAHLLYRICLRMLRKMGFTRHKWQTPTEYAAALQNNLHTIRFSPVRFSEVTAIYNKVCYGGETPDSSDCEKMDTFEASFWITCRRKIGWLRYILRYLTF